MSFAAVRRFVRATPKRTFVVFPIVSLVAEIALRGRPPRPDLRWLPLMVWGYTQYRVVGNYRRARGGGGPGIEVPPDRLVRRGPYALLRNPMYLGHLIFMAGMSLTFGSPVAAGLTLAHAAWFHRQVRADEAQLERRFGDEYREYKARVRRWLPGLL